jgi:pilus assembly protein CpaC
MKPRTPTASLLLLAALAAAAQTASISSKDLTLLTGRGELLQFNADVIRVAVAEPKVADAIVVSPREVMVNAKTPGYTTVVIWEQNAAPVRFNIRVTPDLTDFDAVQRKVKDSLPGAAIEVTGNTETIVLTGDAKDAEESARAAALASTHAKKVVNLLRVPRPPEPRQIMLQVKFASVDRSALSELGFNYLSRNDKVLGSLSTQQFSTPRFSQLQFQDQEFSNSTLNFADLLNLFLFRPDLNIGGTIRALQNRNLLQILAEPNLVAVEGKEASFLAGGQFPFPVLTATSTGGAVAPVITVQFKNFGVELNFTPTVTTEGAIHLKVNPQVSALDFSNAVTLQGFMIPAISTRTANTEVILRDGESFAIAGLLDSRVIQVLTRIRGLGDIPILGHLFRSRSTRKTQDELLVVITPRFVKPLSAEERAKLPATIEPFLPTAEEEAARKSKGKKADKQPELSGPTGHIEPATGPAAQPKKVKAKK